jgi:uncharacterized protein (TIGR02271 family)
MEGEPPRSERFTEVGQRFAGYEVYDPAGQKIGKVDDLFVDEHNAPEYAGVRTGLLGTKTTLIPWEIVEARETERRLIVAADKDTVKDGPAFDDYREVTPELENEVHSYYALRRPTTGTEERRGYGTYHSEPTAGSATGTPATGGTTPSGPADRAGGLAKDDEVRVRRVEEELVAGTREREAGAVRVRKRVLTKHERMEVPVRHEEVRVDRVPVEGEFAAGAEIGEEEVVIPLTEEEVVVEKRPVAKEEIRIRKDVVEDTEVVEEDVRREEVDIDDQTTRRDI